MQKIYNKIRYILYARKSSESEDRQIQSIDDQISRLKELAKNLKLDVVDILTEAKTAKQPGNRPVFAELMQRIEDGEANGILCWQLNRLSRNPVDSGQISWLLQQGIIQSIQTSDREYLPDDNVLLFNVETGMANQYLLDLSKNVKRGIQSKLEKGVLSNMAPLGYLNDKEEKTIVEDEERFPLIRRMYDLMLMGQYTPPKILEIANNEWGFRTRKTKRSGGKELSRSGIYRIFTNPFYMGILTSKEGVEYQGAHKPLVTSEEFDRVQFLLGRKGKPRPKKHKFAFTGMIRCGECGCLITAEHKYKNIKNTDEVRKHTYYHCTRRKKEYVCSQRRVIREQDLEQQVADEIGKLTILPEFEDWALEVLQESNDKEIEDRQTIHETQNRTLEDTQRQLDNLTKMRYRELIDDEMFMKEKKELQGQIRQLRGHLRETEERSDNWIELTEKVFDFATHARDAFINGDLETKKSILTALGSNPILKNGKFSIEANEWFVPIAEKYPALEEEYQRLEPAQMPINKERTEALASIRSRWLRG